METLHSSNQKKFYTDRYKQQMLSLLSFFDTKNDAFLKAILARTPAPTNSVPDMNLDEMIVTLSRDVETLSKINTQELRSTQISYKYEQLEERITQIKTAFKSKFDEQRKTGRLSQEECREYEYINNFMDLYDSLQAKLTATAIQYSKDSELADIEQAIRDYQDFRPLLGASVDEYNQYVQSGNFDSALIPEDILSLIGGGKYDADTLFKQGNLSQILDAIKTRYNQDLQKVKNISAERDKALAALKEASAKEQAKENNNYNTLTQNELSRHSQIESTQNQEINKLMNISDSKRPLDIECSYNDDVEYYKSPAFERVSLKYKDGGLPVKDGNRVSTSWIENIGNLEELSNREAALSEALESLKLEGKAVAENLQHLINLNNELTTKESSLRKLAKIPLSEDLAYINLKQNIEKDEASLKEISDFESELSKNGAHYLAKKKIKDFILFDQMRLRAIAGSESFEDFFDKAERLYKENGMEELFDEVSSVIAKTKSTLEVKLQDLQNDLATYESKRLDDAEKAKRELQENAQQLYETRQIHEQNKLDLEFLKLCIRIVTDQIEQKNISLNKNKALEDLEKMRISSDSEKEWYEKNTEALLQSHIAKLAEILEDRNIKEQEINNVTRDALVPYTNRIPQLKKLYHYINNLALCQKEIVEKAQSLSDAISLFQDKKKSFLDRVLQDRVSTILTMDRFETQSIDKIKILKKEFSNPDSLKEMLDSLNQYLLIRSSIDMASLTGASYADMIKASRDSIHSFIESFCTMGKIPEDAEAKLDSVIYLAKIFDIKEGLLSAFDNEKITIETTVTKKLELQTSSEKAIICQCSQIPQSIFGPWQNEEETGTEERDFSGLLQMAEGTHPNIIAIIEKGIAGYYQGNRELFKDAVAGAILAYILRKDNPKNISELDNIEIAQKLVDVYSSIDWVASYANELFDGEINVAKIKDSLTGRLQPLCSN